MDEFSAAQVKTAVGGAFVVGLEEHQVAGDKLFGAFGAQPQLVLLVSGARDADAVLVEDVLQVAGAVKGLGGGAAELVGDTYVGFGCGYQGGYFRFPASLYLRPRGGIWAWLFSRLARWRCSRCL